MTASDPPPVACRGVMHSVRDANISDAAPCTAAGGTEAVGAIRGTVL